MDLNLATAHKLKPPEVTQELHPPTFLNMVGCLNHKDLSQLARCPLNNPPVNSQVKVATVVRLNLQLNTPTHKCMEVLPALVATVVVSQHPMLSGVLLLLKALEMASVATKDDSPTVIVPSCLFAFSYWWGYELGMCFVFLHLVFSNRADLLVPARPFSMILA